MKKKDILYLIDLTRNRDKNIGISRLGNHDFPKINELKDEFQALVEEMEIRQAEFERQSLELEGLRKTCDHTVRLTYPSGFCTNRICAVCGKSISTANNGTIYNDCNRNSYFCEFPGNCNDEDYSQVGVDVEAVYSYIYKILEDKSDDDEVDLLQEMKKLKPDMCSFTEKPFIKEYYVLIIGGTSRIEFEDNHYISMTNNGIPVDLTRSLIGIPDVKVELLENSEITRYKSFEELFPKNYCSSNSKFEDYETEEELRKKLLFLSENCRFDVVIDMSNIFNVLVENGSIRFENRSLDLQELFENAKIIRLENSFELCTSPEFNKKFSRELLTILGQKLSNSKGITK